MEMRVSVSSLIEGVEMKGHEYVRFGSVGLSADSVQIVGLPQDDGDAVSLQISLDGLGQLIGQVAFAQVQGGVAALTAPLSSRRSWPGLR